MKIKWIILGDKLIDENGIFLCEIREWKKNHTIIIYIENEQTNK